jgi:hypothetical protein
MTRHPAQQRSPAGPADRWDEEHRRTCLRSRAPPARRVQVPVHGQGRRPTSRSCSADQGVLNLADARALTEKNRSLNTPARCNTRSW